MITTETARVTAYALDGMYDRGSFFVANGDYVYEGQLVGEHCKDDDIDVNVTRAKHLTNVRASGKEEAMRVRPPRILSLEQALEYIQDDELVEITPKFIRMRKRILTKTARRCAQRARSSGNPANPT